MLVEQGSNFIVASGDPILNYGPVKVTSKDEYNNNVQLQGNITEVHKPLASAGEVSTRMDAFLFEEGGILIRRNSSLAKDIKQFIMKQISGKKKEAEKEIIRMYKEGGVYNFYLKASGLKVEQVNNIAQEVLAQPTAKDPEGNSGQPTV